MSFIDPFPPQPGDVSASLVGLTQTRAEILREISNKNFFDIVIVGGGIHGAAFARLAAFNGLKTLLLEKNDYASATSSRSSKMAHGGLRYLELFDFVQVMEGIRAREELFELAPHLVSPQDFLVPVPRNRRFFKFQLSLGLKLYDYFVKRKDRKHRWLTSTSWSEKLGFAESPQLRGFYSYTDGLMDDTRLVLENISSARQEGALSLNYCSVESLAQRKDGKVIVSFRDIKNGAHCDVLAGIVVNCAGPWAPGIGRIIQSSLNKKLAFSQGSHLLFNKKWDGPALCLPIGPRGRYYFVWPHFAGTLIGTTERALDKVELDPLPTSSEVDELLTRINKDLPNSGLNSNTLHYGFAGVRSLPLRGNSEDTSRLSRRHIWSYSSGVLTLLGGKFTTASWTALDGLKSVFKLAGINRRIVPLSQRKFPGSIALEQHVSDFLKLCSIRGVSHGVAQGAIRRLGGRVRFLKDYDNELEVIPGDILKAEIKLSLAIEQVESVEDLMRRRLQVEYEPGHGIKGLDNIIEILNNERPDLNWSSQVIEYKSRIGKIHEVLKIKQFKNDAKAEELICQNGRPLQDA